MKKSLLIAEDEEVTLALLRTCSARPDLLVHEARRGRSLQHIDQHPVDVILTDLKMPGRTALRAAPTPKVRRVRGDLMTATRRSKTAVGR